MKKVFLTLLILSLSLKAQEKFHPDVKSFKNIKCSKKESLNSLFKIKFKKIVGDYIADQCFHLEKYYFVRNEKIHRGQASTLAAKFINKDKCTNFKAGGDEIQFFISCKEDMIFSVAIFYRDFLERDKFFKENISPYGGVLKEKEILKPKDQLSTYFLFSSYQGFVPLVRFWNPEADRGLHRVEQELYFLKEEIFNNLNN